MRHNISMQSVRFGTGRRVVRWRYSMSPDASWKNSLRALAISARLLAGLITAGPATADIHTAEINASDLSCWWLGPAYSDGKGVVRISVFARVALILSAFTPSWLPMKHPVVLDLTPDDFHEP
jgi:sigma54-dependent transcription regulator